MITFGLVALSLLFLPILGMACIVYPDSDCSPENRILLRVAGVIFLIIGLIFWWPIFTDIL